MTLPERIVRSAAMQGLHVFLAVLLAVPVVIAASAQLSRAESQFMDEARNVAVIRKALETERPAMPPPASVSGVSVPHHMLAADLIARGIWAASSGRYTRIVLLAPDHFRRLKTPFGVTTAALESVIGRSEGDEAFAASLLGEHPLFSDIGTAEGEHGVHSVVPFVHAVFPDVPIVAVTTAVGATLADWKRAAELIGDLVGPETLVVQSTDYSHHLMLEDAVLRDQETLAVIATRDPDAAADLNQPAHLDSTAAQFIQTWLQRHRYGSQPIVVANRNSAEYVDARGGTTSYVVTVFTRNPESGSLFRYPDQSVVWFGGDFLAGRGFTDLLQDDAVRSMLVDEILRRTGGAPLIVNLEGVILDDRPAGAGPLQLSMPSRLALPLLSDLGVTGASLANNHAWDFGEEGLEATLEFLDAAGVKPLIHGEVADLGNVRLLPLTFRRSYFHDHAVLRTQAQVEEACRVEAAPPLVVLAHWGDDYVETPGAFEMETLGTLGRCGVTALIGAHSHRASPRVGIVSGGALQYMFSLGNLLFDQKGESVSSALVEMRVFGQGTMALRPVSLPNLYERALEAFAEGG